MAESRDVTARLVQGRPAVHNLQEYVWAARQVGYSHPDLTLHAGQIHDWYGSETGMDLEVLRRDGAALEAAASVCQDAVAVQHRQIDALAAAWSGPGAQSCRDFLRRHSEASADVAATVRAAADALTDASERLWRLVDAKVGAVVDIEHRTGPVRAEWLSAAATLSTGAGDRAAASELIDRDVKPFVDDTVRTEWLAVMADTMAGVTDTYRSAAAEVASAPAPVFVVPGELGPVHSGSGECDDRSPARPAPAPVAPAPAPPASPAPTVPSAWSAPPPQTSPPAAAFAPPAPPPASEALTPPVPSASPADLGTGGLGGLGGLGQQFSDTLRGLLGGGADGFEPPDLDAPDVDPLELDEPELEPEEDAAEEDAAEDEAAEDEAAEDEAAEEDAAEEGAAEVAQDDCAPPAETPPESPVATPVPEPPPAVEPLPPPAAEPLAAEQTPCAIAEGEVPQVGEPPR